MGKNIFSLILLVIINVFCLNIIYQNKRIDTIFETIEENNYSLEEDSELLGVLEIPTLNIKGVFYQYDSPHNTVSQNITLIEKSNMPDYKNGNLILAAHRGRSKVAFFESLHLIKEGDKIIIYYHNKKYIYKYNNQYDVKKNGKVKIIRDKDKTTITLITCKKRTNKQTVFIGYLVDTIDV